MDGNLSSQVARCIDVHQRKRRGRQVLTVLAAIVVFCTVYALMMPAVTMSNQVTCGLEAHVHSEDCWTVELSGPRPELVCDAMDYSGVVIHKHNSFCYDEYGELICTLPETELHVHDKSCYQEQRELICQERQEAGHVHDASCWAYDRGELICTEAEGEDAHTHTDDCYQTESRQVLTCTLPEEEPHTHDDSCYTTHTRQELTCGLAESDDKLDAEGNVVESGHHHDDSCYTEVEERELSCTREETEGHHHDESCYTTEEVRTLICGHTETSGHEHGKECYEWTQRLVCQEEEREAGHVHTDECYQITEVLACRRQELAPHTHTESCYNEEGGLICTRPEAIVHDHDASCVHIPEGEMEEIRVLTCGKQEHEHTESCYVELVPKEDDGCLCGKSAHLHTAECYSEFGTLICTMEEHVHTLACMQEAPPEDQEPEEPTGLWLAEDYTYENEEFHLTFHINGYASLAEEEDGVLPDGQEPVVPDRSETPEQPEPPERPVITEQPETPEQPVITEKPVTPEKPAVTERPAAPEKPAAAEKPAVSEKPSVTEEPAVTEKPAAPEEPVIPETPETVEPPPPVVVVPETPEPVEQTPPVVVTPEPEEPEDWGLATSTSTFFSLPSIGVSGLSDGPYADGGDTDADYWANRYVPIGEEQGAPAELDPEDVVFSVEFLEEGEEYESLASLAGELSEDEMLLLRVIDLKAEIGGRPLDLSACTVEVEVTLSEQMLEQIKSFSENQPMAIDGNGAGAVDGDEAETVTPSVTLVAFGKEDDGQVAELASTLVSTSAGSPADEPSRAPARARARVQAAAAPADTAGNTAEAQSTINYTTRGGDPTALSLLMNVYPVFTVEYYARIKHPATEGGFAPLPFIDTSKKGNAKNNVEPEKAVLPVNGDTPKTMNLQLDTNGNVLFDDAGEPERLYADKKFQFNPKEEELTVETLMGMKDNVHYKLSELWALRPGIDPEEAKEEDWTVYTDWRNLSFTNNLNAAGKETPDGQKIVAVQEGAVFRLVYDQVEGTLVNDKPGFYDYDISSGPNTSTSVNTASQGINSTDNVSQDGGARFAFGNANTGTGLDLETWNGNYLNRYNRIQPNGDPLGYLGCTFGLVQGFTGSDVVFSSGVDGPSLFGSASAVGKTSYDDYSLEFKTEGDTHTLTTVRKGGTAVASNLGSFNHPGNYTHIWTNNFWPMDAVTGSDPHFGAGGGNVTGSGGAKFPASDDGTKHNSYFGMTFTVNFTVSEEYQGPLEYYFYGDDDMWVFLDDTLVCDIGGVHSSVGEYVDLWDYIDKGREDHKESAHTMTVFYTERGASGSTCWMQYTLPNAMFVPSILSPNEENTPLTIRKLVDGNLATDELRERDYTFSLKLTKRFESFQASIYNENNQAQKVSFDEASRTWKADPEGSELLTINGEEEAVKFCLKHGWYLKIRDLSSSAGYAVDEIFEGGLPPEGCTTTVQTDVGSQTGEPAAGTHTENSAMGTESKTITFTNSFSYELPETGGSGTVPYALAGGLLITAALWLWYRKKTAEGRGADTT